MTDKETKQAAEVLITVAQMNTLSEQSEMVKGVYKYKTKQDFNMIVNLVDKFVDNIKKTLTDSQIEMLNNMTDVFHEQSDSIRKQILEG